MTPMLKLVCLLPLLLLGCATIGNQSPGLEVTVEHVSAPQLQMFESRASVKIRIDNEGIEPISLLGGVHHLRINGRRIGKAMDDGAIQVPALSSVTRELPLTVSNLGMLRTARETFDEKEVSYRLDSKLYVETASGKRSRSLRREGHVALDELIPKPAQPEQLKPSPAAPATP